MTTPRIEIRAYDILDGDKLTIRAYVWHGEQLVSGIDVMEATPVLVATTGPLHVGRAVQFFRAINPAAEIEFNMSDEFAAAVTAKADAERVGEFYAAAKFAETAAA
jgi:hypothetical protein